MLYNIVLITGILSTGLFAQLSVLKNGSTREPAGTVCLNTETQPTLDSVTSIKQGDLFVLEEEEKIDLENWMIDCQTWGNALCHFYECFKPGCDPLIAWENWMLDPDRLFGPSDIPVALTFLALHLLPSCGAFL